MAITVRLREEKADYDAATPRCKNLIAHSSWRQHWLMAKFHKRNIVSFLSNGNSRNHQLQDWLLWLNHQFQDWHLKMKLMT